MRRGLMVILVAIMSLAIVQAAWAVGGTVTIKYNAGKEVFHGKVQSPNSECRVGRVVKVYKVTADGRQLQGKMRSTDTGAWKVSLMHAHGTYVAVAPTFEGMHATCDRITSDTLDVM
jgi:hypothetical protein